MEAQLQRRPLQEESHSAELEQPVITGTSLPLQTGLDSEKKPIISASGGHDRHDNGTVLEDEDKQQQQNMPSLPKPSDVIMGHEEEDAIHNENLTTSNVRIGKLEDLEEDPQSPRRDVSPSNYQTKVADPTGQGGKEADVGSLLIQGGLDKDKPSKGLDKGVSVKDYLAEKLTPGDEDKALSEAIAEKLYIKKKTNVEDVKSERGSSSSSSPGVVGRLKGVVGSWLGNKSK